MNDRLHICMIVGKKGCVNRIDINATIVSLPPTAKYIDDSACIYGKVSKLFLEDSNIISIREKAFLRCIFLNEITFPASLKIISYGAFARCTSITHIKFPIDSQLNKIGCNAFEMCLNLYSFKFPPNIEIIEYEAFNACTKLKLIDLRRTKVLFIGKYAFGFNPDIFVFLPPTFKSACYLSSYNYCPVINEDHPARQEDACGYFFLNGTIFKGNKKLKHVLIRNGVKTIGNNCFNDSNLVSLTVPASVTEICRFSFANCHKLRKIVFQKDSKLKEIGEMAFQN